MSRRSERIGKLVELASQRADKAARRLGEHGQRLQQATVIKDELAKFRSLYGEQRSRPGQVMSAGALWNSHQFLSRIDQALQQQEQDLGKQTQQSHLLRQQWLQARQRTDALQRVVDKLQAADQSRRLKLEQETADELSALRFARSPRS